MIHIEKNKLVITIPGPAAENWQDIVSDIFDLLYSEDQSFASKHQGTVTLLQHMMPTSEQMANLTKT